MCLFKAYLYVLCGHIDYDIAVRCVQLHREALHIANPGILPEAYYGYDCIPHHPEPENGVGGNLHQFFIVSPDEIGPTASWGNTAEEDDDTDNYEESVFQGEKMKNTRHTISGLCGKCTSAAEELIEMYQTRPHFGLAEEMVLDDAVVPPTPANDEYKRNDDQDSEFHGDYNEEAEKMFYQRQQYLQLQANRSLEEGALFDDLGFPLAITFDGKKITEMTAQQRFAARIDMQNAWAKGCIGTFNDHPPISDTTTATLRNKRNFVKNFDLLDDPFAVHGDNNNSRYLTRSQLSRTHTTNLVIRPKMQQVSDNKRKRSGSFDVSSTATPHAVAAVSSGELHHQDKKRKTSMSMVPDDCPYALRSRQSVSLANGL